MRGEQLGRKLLADQQFDLGGGQRGLHRILLFLDLGGGLLAERFLLLGHAAVVAQRNDVAHGGHAGAQRNEGKHRQARHQRQQAEQSGRHIKRARIGAELAEHRLVGRAARATLGNQQAGGQRNDQRRDLGDEAVADRKLDEDVGRLAETHAMAQIADGDTADDVDGGDDEAGDGVAAHEFGSAVHRAEEGRLFLQFTAAQLRGLVVDHAGGKISVDRHLLAGNGVEGETGADFGDTRRALRDDDEVHHDEDQEHDQADDEVARHDQLRKAADDIAGGVGPFIAVRQDHAGRGDVQRQAQHRGDQQHRWEGREIEWALDPQRHHQDQHRQRDRKGEADVDEESRDRQEQHRQDDDDTQREEDIAAAARHGARRNALADGHIYLTSNACQARNGNPGHAP